MMDIKDVPCGKYVCVRVQLEQEIKALQNRLTAAEIELELVHNLNKSQFETISQLRAQLETPVESVQKDIDAYKAAMESHYPERLTQQTTPAESVQAEDEVINEFGEPEAIYLQLHDPAGSGPSDGSNFRADDVTWCWHRINENDVRYIRQDLATPKVEQVSGGGEPVAEITRAFCDNGYFFTVSWITSKFKEGDKLYLQPSPNKADVPDVASEEMLSAGIESLELGVKMFPENMTQVISNIWEDMYAAALPPLKDE